jgi:hypothetical protein
MFNALLKFNQNRPKKILFSSRLKKGQEKAKWPNQYISRKLFQKRPNGNPVHETAKKVVVHILLTLSLKMFKYSRWNRSVFITMKRF